MATLHFKGKSAVWNHHLSVPYQTLDPVAKMSHKGKDEEENFIIEGDNLTALKSLLPKYQGKIKCIYIDPPYNTGNEGWVYSDNVSNPIIKSWIGETVGREGEDLTRHDKWLCMMTPRMKLLRELLADDGVIFVSIDENEAYNLKNLLDDIFSEKNFVTNFIWNHRKSSQNDIDFSLSHNHTLCYAKDRSQFSLNSLAVDDSKFSNPDNDPRGPWVADPFDAPGVRTNLEYLIVNPNTEKEYLPPNGRHWRTTKKNFEDAIAGNRIVWGKNGKTKPQLKRFLSDAEDKGTNPFTIWDEIGTATEGTKELMKLFEGEKLFDTPKPVSLLKKILTLATDKDSIVLDSFAGSGSTAHAVLEMNKEDGGNRKFILVQIPEETGKDSAAYKAGYKTVQEITQARVKKVIERDNLDTGFTYYRLGQQIDADGILTGDLPSYNDFAKYVYYLATGKNYPTKSKVDAKKYFVGKDESTAIFLVYENDFDKLKSMALTLDLAKDLHKQHEGRKIVYAPACFLDEYHLDQFNITFVGIPFNLFERN